MDELTRLHEVEIQPRQLIEGIGFEVNLTMQPEGVAISGEIDFYNRVQFEAALDAALASFTGDVRVDLAGLRFIDVGGMSALLRCTRRLKNGQTLVLHGMRPYIENVFRLLEWDRIARLRLE